MAGNWRERYADKIVPAAFAAKKIRPGDRVFIGSACGEPQALVRAMVQAGEKLADTEIVHVLTLGVAPYADPKYAPHFRANAFFIGAGVRGAVNEARADYTPIFLSQVPRLFKSHSVPIDVALIMVSPPDEHGFCSLGVSVDITKAAAESAKLIIAQVNAHMPYSLGDCFVHVNQISYLVEHDEPLIEFPSTGQTDDSTHQIASHIARLVPDGSTLQLGIGRIPDAVLDSLAHKNDLGIHTEMFSDGVMRLARAGVITGKYKRLHKGKIVGSFAAGSHELFRFLHENPQIEMHPSDYTNDPFIISQHDNMVAINAALEVDLTGQVCADSIGQQFYSGIGGHADFIRGAALAKNGKPIIALPSTARGANGQLRSRITPVLQEGAGVVTTRGDTHYVVTEYGVAYLHGRSMRERAMSLLGVAHPDFRADLLHAAKHRRIVYPNQIMPPVRQPYPAHLETSTTLRDNSVVTIRPIRADDEPRIKEMFYSFSEQTVYLRFHAVLKSMPHNKLQVFCNVDYDTEMALVATIGQPGDEDIIGVGRYMSDPSKTSAEMAFSVRDDWQRKGLGTLLFRRLLEIGQQFGIRRFTAEVLVENSGMLKIFHRSGLSIETSTESGVVHVVMTLPDQPQERPPAKAVQPQPV
jgi:acyl-CoA hydrolase/GNAT superfamily N-acetyltransferase